MWVILIVIALSGTYSVAVPSDVQLFCPEHNPQKSLDVKLLMGIWHVVEVVDHLPHRGYGRQQDIIMYHCPTLHLTQDHLGSIRLSWHEPGTSVFYQTKKPDQSAPGYWVASGPHDENSVDPYSQHYYPMTGAIEVMKAVGDHVVLTFCKSDHDNSQLFSVVLAKHKKLAYHETAAVNSMLKIRGLQPVLVKNMCNGAAEKVVATSLFLLLAFLFFT